MAKTIAVSDDVREVLERSEITENSLTLPPEQLDPKFYQKVNKIIVAAGGKWSKSAKCHLFESDPRAALGLALKTGKIANQQQVFQEFFTPEWLAERMAEDVEFHCRVLEPSAGIGRIATAAADMAQRVFCVELQARHVETLRSDKRLLVWEGDFLKFPHDMLRPFDFVLMNPPFSDGQETQHVRHAFDFLTESGVLRSVMSSGVKFREQKRDVEFRKWLDGYSHEFEELPDDTFKESGTRVNTVLLTIRK